MSSALNKFFKDYPRTHAFPENLLPAVEEVESAGDETARSGSGATGPMQIIPKPLGLSEKDIADPDVNREVGARYLDKLQKQFDGDTYRALRAYNQGPKYERNRKEKDVPQETKDYPGAVIYRDESRKQDTPASFEQWKKDHPIIHDTVEIPSAGETLTKIAKEGVSNFESLGRGAAAVIPGIAGDAEEMLRKGINWSFGAGGVKVKEEPVLRTTAEWLKKYPQRFTTPTAQAEGMETLGSAMNIAGPGEVLKAGKAIAEAPSVRAGSIAAQRGILGPATKAEQLDFNRLIAQGKTPEEAWAKTQTMKTDEGLFKRIDDSKSKWTGDIAVRTLRPDKAQKLDDAKEALAAYIEGRLPKTHGAWELQAKVEAKGGTGADYHNIIEDADQSLHLPMTKAEGIPLGAVIHHSGLFYRHPELKNYKVRIGSEQELGGARGHHDVTNNEIVLGKQGWMDAFSGVSDQPRSIMLHEIQHAVDTGRKTTLGDIITDGANAKHIKSSREDKLYVADSNLSMSQKSVDTIRTAKKVAQYLDDGEANSIDQAISKVLADAEHTGSASDYRPGGTQRDRLSYLATLGDAELDRLHKVALERHTKLGEEYNKVPLPVSREEAHRLYMADKGETRARYAQQTMDVTNKDAPYPMGDANAPGTFDIPIEDQLGVGGVYTSRVSPPSANRTKPKFKKP